MEKPYSMLIVDDEKGICDMYSFFAEKNGFNPKTAYSGREALIKTEKENIDVIVSDIDMPGGDGFELVEKLYQRKYKGIIVMNTGKMPIHGPKLEKLSQEHKIQYFFSKPPNFNKEFNYIKSIIENHNK